MVGEVLPDAEPPVGELEALMRAYQQADAAAADMLFSPLSPQVFQFFLGRFAIANKPKIFCRSFGCEYIKRVPRFVPANHYCLGSMRLQDA